MVIVWVRPLNVWLPAPKVVVMLEPICTAVAKLLVELHHNWNLLISLWYKCPW